MGDDFLIEFCFYSIWRKGWTSSRWLADYARQGRMNILPNPKTFAAEQI